MLSSWIRTIDPAVEPVTVAQAKAQSRVTISDDDALIAIYVKAAREYVEAATNRALLAQTWRVSFSHFPRLRRGVTHGDVCGWSSYGYGACFGSSGWWATPASLLLPRPRLIGIGQLAYTDVNGAPQVLDPSLYTVGYDAEPATLTPNFGTWWPATLPNTPNAVQVTYTAGYGNTPAAVPSDLQLAILMLAGHWYENREATVLPTTGTGPMEIPLGVQALLSPYTLPIFTYEVG